MEGSRTCLKKARKPAKTTEDKEKKSKTVNKKRKQFLKEFTTKRYQGVATN